MVYAACKFAGQVNWQTWAGSASRGLWLRGLRQFDEGFGAGVRDRAEKPGRARAEVDDDDGCEKDEENTEDEKDTSKFIENLNKE